MVFDVLILCFLRSSLCSCLRCMYGFCISSFFPLFFFEGCGNDRSVYGGCLIGMLRVSMVCVFFDSSDYLHGA